VELDRVARAQGYRLLDLDEVDSTNDEARRLIDAGERGPLWIVAKRQTKGRGRLGREWVSTQGNLHASLIVSDHIDMTLAPQLGFVVGVATINALRLLAPYVRDVALKWPNDLVYLGAKLGGVLLENVAVPTGDARQPQLSVAIIGIGVNCAEAPKGLETPTKALAELLTPAPDAAQFFRTLTQTLAQTLDLWRHGAGFALIRDEWLGAAAGLGETIRIVLGQETVTGKFDTIDKDGRLVLATPHGPRVIEAGDVLLGPRPVSTEMRAW